MPPKKLKSPDQRTSTLRGLQKQRNATQLRTRGDDRNYSLEGLRLSALLSQVQAVQAVQGLRDLRPQERKGRRRFAFSSDVEECVRQRQWLAFKADWLEALLEDTVAELAALEKHEAQLGTAGDASENGANAAGKSGVNSREG